MDDMAITDELRSVAAKTECANGRCEKLYRGDLETIADRIDAEHAEAQRRWMAELDAARDRDGFIELPKDADGVPIHVGDTVTCGRSVWQVTGLRLTGLAWGVCCTIFNDHGGSGTNVYPPCNIRHHHAPTVEDVLTELTDEVWNRYCFGGTASDSGIRELVAEYAVKLRLAGDAE